MQPFASTPRDQPLTSAPSGPIRVVPSQALGAARVEALKALHADLARSEKNLADLVRGLRGQARTATAPTAPTAPTVPTVRAPPSPTPSFVITDESAVWTGAIASAARAAVRFETPWSDPSEAEGSAQGSA